MAYLGLPFGGNPCSFGTWHFTKVRNGFATWKRDHLSLGSRIILIKATMTNLPVYYLPVFKNLMKVAAVIERSERNFFGRKEETLKLGYLVRWDKVFQTATVGVCAFGVLRKETMLLGK